VRVFCANWFNFLWPFLVNFIFVTPCCCWLSVFVVVVVAGGCCFDLCSACIVFFLWPTVDSCSRAEHFGLWRVSLSVCLSVSRSLVGQCKHSLTHTIRQTLHSDFLQCTAATIETFFMLFYGLFAEQQLNSNRNRRTNSQHLSENKQSKFHRGVGRLGATRFDGHFRLSSLVDRKAEMKFLGHIFQCQQ